jgi:N-acetylglutamate synthase/N-acetylornithine aminotransferase
VELGLGKGSAYFLTSDLTTEYVEINAFEKS